MRHLGTKIIETARLRLRQLSPQDSAAMYQNWANDPLVTRFLRWEPHNNELETVQLLTAWSTLYQNDDYYEWGICLKETDQLIGGISIMKSENLPSAEVCEALGISLLQGAFEPGYCIGRAFWGNGYTTEALCAVRDFWFDEVGGDWLACCHATENPASGRVMQKAGFAYRHDAQYTKFDGTPVDCRVYYLKKPAL